MTDPGGSSAAGNISDKVQFTRTFKKKEKNQDDGQGEKRVDVKERHRGVERDLDPEGQRPGMSTLHVLAKELFAPMPEQKQADRDCVKQSALSHKHG